jgi:DNA replication protein DnaC
MKTCEDRKLLNNLSLTYKLMNTQSTLEQLRQLKLFGMAGTYQAVLEQPLHQQPEPHLLLGMLTEAELQHRQMARTELYLRLSKLRYQALPEQVNCSPERGLLKEQLIQLCDGLFIQKGDNVLITGATGCGKSFLACALGRKACMLGFRTVYYSMNRFLEALGAARLDGTYLKAILDRLTAHAHKIELKGESLRKIK